MSFFSDLFQGNFSNLGNDLAPSNIFSDTASSFANQPGWAQGLEIAVPAALAAFAAPEVLPALFAGGAEGAGGLGAAEAAVGGFDLSTIGTGVTAEGGALGGGGALSGLTSADVTFLDPSLLGEAAAPGATAPAVGGGFSGAGTALDMGGGGVLSPADAFAQGFPAGGAGGAIPSAPAAPSFAQDLTSSELLAGTGVGGGSPVGSFGAAPGAAGGGGIMDTLSAIGGGLKTASPLIGAGALGLNLYSGLQEKKALGTLAQTEAQAAQEAQNTRAAANQAAQPLLTSGQVLTQYLTTNTLPPQFQSQVDQWVKAQKAAVTQGYASRGQSGDPKQNSALQQDLANIDQQALGLQAQFEEILSSAGQQMITTANQLLSTGLNATQLGAEIPIQIAKLNATLNAQMSSAISNFAAALNGSNRQNAPGSLNISLNPQTGALQ